jgi:putative ABC transport system substrate-binding protein
LIYCLSPSVFVGPEQHSGPRIRVYVAPQAEVLLSRLREIQPHLRRLVVFDILSSPTAVNYFQNLQQLARTDGVEVRMEYLAHAEELPDRLRSLAGKMDAIWLPPDPLLITPSAFAMVREFSRSNSVPLYVPIDSLVDKGATACVGSSFREMGRTAGRLAVKAVAGHLENVEAVYPDRVDLTLNLTAAALSGLTISPAVVQKADRVVSPSEEWR